MANQRGQIVMNDAEVSWFLTEQRSSTVATLGPQGHVWIETKRKAQKVGNLRRDPRMSFLVEAGHTYDRLRGVAIAGTGVLADDPDVVWDVCVRIFERYNAPYTPSSNRSWS